MPQSDNHSWTILLHRSQAGLTTTDPIRAMSVRTGTKGSKGDPKPYPPRALTGKYADKGVVTRAANPPLQSYQPSPFAGSFPYTSTQSISYLDDLRNKSWDRLMEDVKGESSSLGVSLAESREGFNMIANRIIKTRRAYQDLRRGNFRGFLRQLSVDPKRKHRSVIRTASGEASGLWLEYWFGWSPLCKDIFDTAVTLSTPHVTTWYACKGTASKALPQQEAGVGNGYENRLMTASGRGFWRQGAQFRVTSENAFLANRLGLVNPVAIAWELVPFSFVVDWFAKVGNWIEGYSDLFGTEHRRPYSTRFVRLTCTGRYGQSRFGNPPGNYCWMQWKAARIERTLGLSRPVPLVPRIGNFGTSITRAATAASLLRQVFIKG